MFTVWGQQNNAVFSVVCFMQDTFIKNEGLYDLSFCRFKTLKRTEEARWQGFTCWSTVVGEQGLSQPQQHS